jgi:ADP-heptose:LPS heptosyltransferase
MSFSHPPKILIIHAGGIGDLLLALPALRAFRMAFPVSSPELLGLPERLSLIAHDLGAASIHSLHQAGLAHFYLKGGVLPSRFVEFFSLFSAAILIGRSQAETLAENLRRAGLARVIFLPSFPEEGERLHVSDALLKALRSFGIEGQGSFSPLRLSGEALSSADELLNKAGWKRGGRILAIHPGSGSPAKNWSPRKFALVADWASERALIVLISGPARDGRDEVLMAVKKSRPFVLDQLPLPDLAAVLTKCTAFLGNDSGITHLAARTGIPTVALFGPTDSAVWGPRGPGVRIMTAEKTCVPCSSEERQACPRSCLEEIEPEGVIKKMAPIFETGATSPGG